MKFGQNLPHNQVPEWASSYIDYKALKKIIKSTKNETRAGEDADLASTVRLASPLKRKP
jgi:glycerophosphodiester phosphodiesterase